MFHDITTLAKNVESLHDITTLVKNVESLHDIIFPMLVKFVDLNIWMGGKLLNSAVEFLSKENPDILTIQEAYNGLDDSLPENERTIKVLKDKLSFEYVYVSKCFLDKRTKGQVDMCNVIFSKYPILKSGDKFFREGYGAYSVLPEELPRLPRTVQHSEIRLGEKYLNVFNTHGVWGTDGNDNERRLEMSKIITDEIRDKENVVLAGDFNVQPGTKTVGNIEKYLKNVFKDELVTSFNMKRKIKTGGYDRAVVDMAFVSKNIKVVNHKCSKVDISDHLPLVCTFEI